MKTLLACLGATLVVFGLVVGLAPHSVERVAAPPLTCGSPWLPATGLPGAAAGDLAGGYADPITRCVAENGVLGSMAAFVGAAGTLVVIGVGLAAALRRGPGRGTGSGVPGIPEPRAAEVELVELVELSPYDATPVAREPIG